MRPDDGLTVLLALKDRPQFTFRWMAYADSVHFPFTVYVADGGLDSSVGTALADPAAFPNMKYEYRRYAPDVRYVDFYAKMADALARIQTPFVVMADNDDFFVVSGLLEAMAFLRSNPDYVACGGQFAAFWVADEARVHGAPYGRRVIWKCSSDARSLDDASARDRVRRLSRWAGYPTYYHVRRTKELQRQFAILRDLNIRDIFLHEQLIAFLTAISGRTRQLGALYLARQSNSPQTSSGTHREKFGDWLGRMFVPSWSEDFAGFLHATSAALAARDRIAIDEARRTIVESYRMAVAPALLGDLMKERTVALPRSLVVWLARRLLTLPPGSAIRRTARSIYRRVGWIAPDVVIGTGVGSRGVPGARRQIAPIHQFLTRQPIGAADRS